MAKIETIDQYFAEGCGRCKRFQTEDCSTQQWAQGLAKLREICLDLGLEETLKWSHPAYLYNGGIVAILGAFRNDFHLSFFKAGLLKDEAGLLIKRGENTQTAYAMSFSDNAEVTEKETVIREYLQEAIANEAAGLKPVKKQAELNMPQSLIDALDNDPELAEAFWALTPGRQRGYAMTISQAKQLTTQQARIEKYRENILAGKGFQDR